MPEKQDRRVHWVAATVMVFIAVVGVSAFGWFFGLVGSRELLQAVAFVSVFLAPPLALYLLPLYRGGLRRTASRLRFAWNSAPLRRTGFFY
jgi:hypothetical protein